MRTLKSVFAFVATPFVLLALGLSVIFAAVVGGIRELLRGFRLEMRGYDVMERSRRIGEELRKQQR